MIRYGICTNIDNDCLKAKSSEVISIDGAKDFNCPDCGSELYEVSKPTPKRPKWLKPVAVIALLCLSIGIVWALWKPEPSAKPLSIKIIGLDCQTGVLSLTTTGGDDNVITYEIDGLKSGQESNEFIIPDSMRNDKLLLVYASQNGNKVDTTFTTSCVSKTIVNPGLPRPQNPNPPGVGTSPPRPITWTRVPGSEFCDDLTECVQIYSERNNLGQIRERRIENCADCGAAKK